MMAAPMLPVDLYRRPMFALSSLTSVCSFAAQGLAFVSLPFYFQTVLGRSAVETGLLLTSWPVVTAVMAPVAGPLSDRYPPAVLGGIGMAALAAGLLLVAGVEAVHILSETVTTPAALHKHARVDGGRLSYPAEAAVSP